MEQINYEKKYKEALGRANAKIETYNHLGNASAVKSICEIFPELKDGEDEKIKTNIIKLLRFVRDTYHQYSDECDEAIAWVEKQSTPQVRKGNEWVNIIDDACEHRYAEEYAHGEYCHQQSFRWGFQEGVDWLEKQDQKKHEEELENAYKCADEVQYRKWYEDAKREFEKHGEKFIPEDINEAALQYVDTCPVDGEITHDNVTEPYWNNHSMMNAYKAGWLEKHGLVQK